MTYAIPTSAQVLAGYYNLTPHLKGVDPEMVVEMADSTVLGDTGRKSLPALTSGGIGFEALYDRTTGSAFDVIRAALQSASQQIVTSFPEGSSIGFPADLCYSNATRFGTPVKLADLTGVAGYFKSAEDGVDLGVSLHALTAETSSTNSTAVDNGAATTNGGVAHLHVTAVSGSPTVTVKVQASSNGTVWTDLVTFTAITAPTSERVEVTSGTARYLRAISTFSGGSSPSITYAVAFARR